MPEIPGNNAVPGSTVPGRSSIPPRSPGLDSSANTSGATGPLQIGPNMEAASKAAQKAARFFGFHTEASIMARLAGMGLSPTLGNLRIAQQLLRYGQGLDPEMVNQLANLWAQYGGHDVTQLEALVVLNAQGLPINGQNLQAMLQMLAGGPPSHLLARLTMAIKSEQNPKLAGVGKRLNAFWQLGHLDKDMIKQLGEFQKELAGLNDELSRVDVRGLSNETLTEIGRLRDLFDAHKLLADQAPNPAQYLPFFVWRDQQPMPGEVIVQNEGGGGELGAAPFMRVTLAVETKNLGRITVDITYVREHLNARFEVVDEKIKKLVDTRLVLLRQRLVSCPYIVDILGCQAVGNARAVSALLPKRRDLKKLSRAQGIL